MNRKTILRVVSKTLIPFILLFAFYTQFHGDFGPGGGFQAGVILAAAFVLYGLICGLDATRAVVSDRTIELLAAAGVLLYAGGASPPWRWGATSSTTTSCIQRAATMANTWASCWSSWAWASRCRP